MPRSLPDELLEEVLLRLPPQAPASLVRAALVSRRWCRIVSDLGFRRRFREFHRSPPMLGMLCNLFDDACKVDKVRFVPTAAFPSPQTDFLGMRVLDARHGRVLCERDDGVLVVWNPITDEVREFPFPQEKGNPSTAAVLCSAAAGACDHLDCHHGPLSFLVVYVCFDYRYGTTVVYTYSSDAAAWSEPVWPQPRQCYAFLYCMGSALVGNALYFGNIGGIMSLKYDLESCQASLIRLPSLSQRWSLGSSMLTTMEDGGLELVTKDGSKLYMWSREDTHEADANWERRVIDLKTVFPADVVVTKLDVIGTGVGIIFMRTGDEVYTIDLKTYKVKKVYEGIARDIFPYMSFYTPAKALALVTVQDQVQATQAHDKLKVQQ